MRRVFPLIVFCLLVARSSGLFAQTVYPGKVILTAPSLEGEASLRGFGTQGGFSVEGFPAKKITGSILLGYRWLADDDGITPLPHADIMAGYRIAIPGPVSLTPLAGAGTEVLFGDGTASPVFDLSLAVRVSLLLAGRDYLTLTPSVTLPASDALSPRISLAVGTRRERPWLVPVPEVHARIGAEPVIFSPDGDGRDDTATILISAKKPKSVRDWKVTVYAPDGKRYREFGGAGRPPERLAWDGTSADGTESGPGIDYRLVLETVDILGRTETANASLTVDILVVRDGDRYKIKVPDIQFPAYSSDLAGAESRSLLDENRATLERLAALLARFPDYKLIVEGHANAINWEDPAKRETENREILIPLSEKRAKTVKEALVLLGVGESRIVTAGRGGERPVADFSDQGNIWKNRRVEFILAK